MIDKVGLHERSLAAIVTTLAFTAGCGESVVPGDPLIGTWRSDPFSTVYPGPPSMAEEIDEFTFARDGSMTAAITRRYPVVADDPYSGCTWIERHTGWVWLRSDAGATLFFGTIAGSHAQWSTERTGCTDPARNHALETFADDGPLVPPVFAYSIAGDRLTLTADVLGPGGTAPPPQHFTRVR